MGGGIALGQSEARGLKTCAGVEAPYVTADVLAFLGILMPERCEKTDLSQPSVALSQ